MREGSMTTTRLPGGLRKLVDRAHETYDWRFETYGARLSSTLYRKFEKSLLGDHSQRILQLTTFYSPESYLCRPVQSLRPGSLSQAFHFYAKLFSPERQLANKGHGAGLTYDSIRFANTTISLGELLCFATDFGLMPRVISRDAVLFAWQRHQRWKKHMDASYRGNELRYDDFVEVLVRCALLAYPTIASARERVEALARLLRLHDSKWFAQRLESIGRIVGATKEPNASLQQHRRTSVGKIEGVENAHRPVNDKAQSVKDHVRNSVLHSLSNGKQPRRKSIADVAASALLAYNPQLADKMATHAHNSTSPTPANAQAAKPVSYSVREQRRNRQRARFMHADEMFSFEQCELLEKYRYEEGSVKWLPFAGPHVDMGVLVLGTRHSFCVKALNTSSNVFQLEGAVEGVPDCCVDFDPRSTPQGFSRNMIIRVRCNAPGEYLGELVVNAFVCSDSKVRPRQLHSTYRCPVYCNVQDPNHNARFRSLPARLEALGLGGSGGGGGGQDNTTNMGAEEAETSRTSTTKHKPLSRSATSHSVGPVLRTKQESRRIVFGMSLPSPAVFAKGENITLDLHPTKRPLPLQIASRAGLRTCASHTSIA